MRLGLLLREAVHELNIRGLTLASRFLCEQLVGLSNEENPVREEESIESHEQLMKDPMRQDFSSDDLVLFGNSLIVVGEYQRCAQIIRSRKGRELFADCPVPTTRSLRELQFLAAYSYYMAGENIKDQLEHESSGYHDSVSINITNAGNRTPSRNPYLTDLYHELMSLYLIDRFWPPLFLQGAEVLFLTEGQSLFYRRTFPLREGVPLLMNRLWPCL